MKKIISIIILALLIVGIIPNAWAENGTADSKKRGILDALGIMRIENDSEYVTRKEFFNGLLYMVYDSFDEEAVKGLLAGKGIILDESDNLYAGDNYITYNDAVTSVVTILGYDQVARWDGDYTEGYKKIAQNIGLLKGVVGERTLSIKREYLANLLYNAIKAEPATMSFSGGNIAYETAKGETILSVSRKIYELSGIVEANQYTSLIGEAGNFKEQVTIGGENYYINGTNADELLGSYVKGYFQKNDNDDGKIIYLAKEEGKMSELVIDAEDILSVSADCSEITYQSGKNSSTKRANISSKVRVIYNGKFYDGYTNSDFEVQNGNLRLVDNNSDNKYDCVFITSYETMIVEYTEPEDFKIHGKYSYSGAYNDLTLEDRKDNPNIRYYLDGEETDFITINQNDILTIQRSKGTNDIIANIYISRNVIQGIVTSLNREESIITVDDTEYKVLKCCFDEMDTKGGIELSTEYSFYMDSFGKLAYIKPAQTTDYCLFFKIKYDRLEDVYNVTYLNDSSEWITAPLADRVTYNGNKDMAYNVYQSIKTDLIKPEVVLIKCNTAGQIKSFTTAQLGKKGEVPLAKTITQDLKYYSEPKFFGSKYYIESGAKVFVMPETATDDREDYYVTTSKYFRNNNKYTITFYDVDEFNFAGVVGISEGTTEITRWKSYLFVVEGVFRKLNNNNDEDEVVTAITGSMGPYVNLEYELKESANQNISKGNIIRLHTDSNDRIDNWRLVASSDFESSSTDLMGDPEYLDATVTAIEYMSGKLKIKFSDNSEKGIKFDKSATVLVHDSTWNTCKAGSVKNMIIGDHIYIRVNKGVAREFIVLR